LSLSGQRVKFAQDADNGLALAIRGDESGRLIRYGRLYTETGSLQFTL